MTVRNIAVVNETMTSKQLGEGFGRYARAFSADPNGGGSRDGGNSKVFTEDQWHEREQELCAKYKKTIDGLQHEVARQNVSRVELIVHRPCYLPVCPVSAHARLCVVNCMRESCVRG